MGCDSFSFPLLFQNLHTMATFTTATPWHDAEKPLKGRTEDAFVLARLMQEAGFEGCFLHPKMTAEEYFAVRCRCDMRCRRTLVHHDRVVTITARNASIEMLDENYDCFYNGVLLDEVDYPPVSDEFLAALGKSRMRTAAVDLVYRLGLDDARRDMALKDVEVNIVSMVSMTSYFRVCNTNAGKVAYYKPYVLKRLCSGEEISNGTFITVVQDAERFLDNYELDEVMYAHAQHTCGYSAWGLRAFLSYVRGLHKRNIDNVTLHPHRNCNPQLACAVADYCVRLGVAGYRLNKAVRYELAAVTSALEMYVDKDSMSVIASYLYAGPMKTPKRRTRMVLPRAAKRRRL